MHLFFTLGNQAECPRYLFNHFLGCYKENQAVDLVISKQPYYRIQKYLTQTAGYYTQLCFPPSQQDLEAQSYKFQMPAELYGKIRSLVL